MAAVLRFSNASNLFGLMSAHAFRAQAKKAGFEWDPRGFLKTPSPFRALQFVQLADAAAKAALRPYLAAIAESQATNAIIPIPRPSGLEYLPFQKAGIVYASKRPACLIGDEPGLGKTIQAIGVANYLGLKRILVICPAGLRINWAREMEKWHVKNPGIEVILNGKSPIPPGRSIVISYDLLKTRAKTLVNEKFDLAIADEGHYLKNRRAIRTKVVLGVGRMGGLICCAPRRLILTGTPVPNRVNEIFPIIQRLAPHVIDSMTYGAFLAHYAVVLSGQYGDQIVGIKNEAELYTRLRAGFMVRRLKKDVLKDLPPKQYKMVVFSKDGFRKVLARESQFSASEILKHGAAVGSVLPEIRREMGIEKAPIAVQYIDDLLESGVQKVIVFAHHREVISILRRGLSSYGVVTITGETEQKDRQENIDQFQKGGVRVFIGNIQAAGVGNTLTASSDVVFAEASWVPGENEQAEDRAHRVGQDRGVLIHYLVVEESLDATILGAAARKRGNITKILDGGISECIAK